MTPLQIGIVVIIVTLLICMTAMTMVKTPIPEVMPILMTACVGSLFKTDGKKDAGG